MSEATFNPYRAPGADLTSAPEKPSPEALRPVPFEDLDAEPRFWRRVWAMFTILFREPKNLADRIPVTRKLSAPWSFMIVLGIPGYLFGVFIAALLVFAGTMAQLESSSNGVDAPPVWLLGLIPLFFLLLVPLMQYVGMIVAGLLNHACLWLWGGLRQGRDLNATFRASGYFLAYFTLVSWIPLVGSVAILLGPGALGVALARIHRTDTWRGICAAYTPLVACCCLYGVFLVAMMAIAAIGGTLTN